MILVDHSQTVCKDGAALTEKKRSDRGFHSFLAHIASWGEPVTGLERVMVVVVDLDRRVHLMHSLLSVRVDFYFTSRRIFNYLVDLPA